MINLKHKRHPRGPRLDRRNAVKNIDYDASTSGLTSPSSSSDFSGRTSLRLEGNDGEFDQIIRYLGFSGPEDFSIPVAAWEARKNSNNITSSADLRTHRFGDRSDSDEFESGVRVSVSEGEVKLGFHTEDKAGDERIRLSLTNGGWGSEGFRSHKVVPPVHVKQQVVELDDFADKFGDRIAIGNGLAKDRSQLDFNGCDVSSPVVREKKVESELDINVGPGIRGVRPPKLAPPPAITHSVMVDDTSTTWDLFRSFGPQDDKDYISNLTDEAEEVEPDSRLIIDGRQECNEDERSIGLDSCSDSSNGDVDADSVGLVCENDHTVSPNGSFRCNIRSWQRGDFLGSGSFGTVYEGFTDDGLFFAVKEVSLLDNGNQGQQSLFQLEQEISLLSQFQHENIVHYLGTDRDHAKLYIFLELVTKGSLASLYQRYQLRDSQVSAYTRQILSGLNYLHCRNVVHRDIKCANILVDVSGSVKLADFGLAKASKLNDIKSCKGTPFWMAPEVVNNQRSHGYGRAADIWSLGCTVLEMLTGRIPYSHLEGMQALFRIGRGELPHLPNTLSRDSHDFILKCLQVNPDDRPSAAKLLEHPFVRRTQSTFTSPSSPHYNAMRL